MPRKVLVDRWCKFEDIHKAQDRTLLNVLSSSLSGGCLDQHETQGGDGYGNIEVWDGHEKQGCIIRVSEADSDGYNQLKR